MNFSGSAAWSARSAGYFLASMALVPSLDAQQLITIGTGTGTNDFDTYPAPYGNQAAGSRHQVLIWASELQAAGMGPGDISSVAFEVAEAALAEFQSFTVSIGTTEDSELGGGWIPGLTPVWGPLDYIDQNGWNTHVFDAPFTWNGTSNLVVQTCFSNFDGNFNARHYQTATSFNSTLVRATMNPNVCNSNMGTLVPYDVRPNLRFEWTSNEQAPGAAFTQSAVTTCTGTIQFTDLSTYEPDAWEWHFGDGGTDSVQDPLYVYPVDGTYVPMLIASNAFGVDTVFGAAITVSTNGPQPVAACIPVSTGTIAGFGILGVTIDGTTTTSGDALTEGYADRGCALDTVMVGTLLQLSVITGSVATHNVRAWIDWDNSGDYIGSELVLSANSVFSASAGISVPVFAVLDTPLRLRVMADYDFSPLPDPCTGPQYGQAEDYGLVVIANTTPPEAGFSASPVFSCDGVVQFTDASLNAPTSWAWTFGDGGTSDQPSPTHTYTASGTYSVQLIVTNPFGGDTIVQTDLIEVDFSGALQPNACTPQTQGYCCGFGITGVQFAGISSSSPDGVEGYVDRSCGNVALVDEGAPYPISIGTGGDVSHDVVVWIDLDNSGDFSASEEVWSALDQQDPGGNLIIPSADAFGVPVRMRITADVVGEVGGPCDGALFGQTEDFSVIISPNPNPPTALFTAAPTNTCTGYVQFTDVSLNAPETWAWTFGDGGTSDQPSPLHQYLSPGTYTVSLTVTNPNGTDSQTAVDLIHFVEQAYCDTLTMPGFQDAFSEACQGVLADDGGPNENYSQGESGAFTIAPLNAETVTLFFSQFEWETDFDYLRIYDGPDIFSPEIGGFSGSGVDVLPNNGVITSTGPAITILQDASNGPITWEGFILSWDCSYTGIPETGTDPIANIWPQPASDHVVVSFTAPAGAGERLVLHDALGAEIVNDPIARGSRDIRIDTEAIAPGAYAISVITPRGRWSRSIIVR